MDWYGGASRFSWVCQALWLAGIGIADGSVVFLLALLASRGGLTITGNMGLAETIEAPATGLEDLLMGINIGHRRAAYG